MLDDYQHRGLGTLLLKLLARQARRNGITNFVSHILWDNREILETLAAAGARIEPEEPGVARVAIEISAPESPTLASSFRAALGHSGEQPGRLSGPGPSRRPRATKPSTNSRCFSS